MNAEHVVIPLHPRDAQEAVRLLRLLADWFDLRDEMEPAYADTGVQNDLRRWASALEAAVSVESLIHKSLASEPTPAHMIWVEVTP